MSTVAKEIAETLPLRHVVPRRRRQRRPAAARVPLQWHDVPVAATLSAANSRGAPPRRWLATSALLAVIVAHAFAVWIGNRHSPGTEPKAAPQKLAIEFVKPPAPPKVEPPPPPPPPKAQQRKAPPPIQAAAVVPSEAPVATPAETVAAVTPAEPAPPPPSAPAPVNPAYGGIGYMNNPAPEYPSLAARQGWQGTVLLRVKVLASGAVAAVEVVKSSGKKLLDDAAIQTVQRWVFAPSTQGDQAIDGFATVPIEFKLDS